MITSTERILTTHVGSMPRPQVVVDQLFAQDRDEQYDQAEFDRVMRQAVREVAAKQVEAGVDVVSDGEMSKISYVTYMRHRFTGFEIADVPRATPQDLDDFPAYKERLANAGGTPKYHRPVVRDAIKIKDLSPLEKDIENLLAAKEEAGAVEAFMNSASPGVVAGFQPNEYYATREEYLWALTEVLKVEYEKINEAGLLLQVDCPDLAMGWHILYRDLDIAAFKTGGARAGRGAELRALECARRARPASPLLGQL